MAHIEKRDQAGTTRYRAHYRDPAGVQRSKSFIRKEDARQYLVSVESSKQTGSYVDPARGKMTLGDLADEWMASKVSISKTTRARYEAAIKVHIRPRWGTTPIGKVAHEDIQQWVVTLVASGAQPGSVDKIVTVMSGMLSKAVRDRRLVSNPAHDLDLPRVRPERRRYLNAAQVEAMADAAGHARVAVLVLAYCGLRWSELAGLRVRTVDIVRRRIEIVETMTEVNGGVELVWGPPKDYERRSVPVPVSVLDELNQLLNDDQGHRRDGEALIFTGSRGGPYRNRNARRSWFDHAAVVAGVAGLTPHELRHTAASLAVSAGANVLAVSRMLGHSNPNETLKTYADLFDSDLDAVAEKLDDLRAAYSLPNVAQASA